MAGAYATPTQPRSIAGIGRPPRDCDGPIDRPDRPDDDLHRRRPEYTVADHWRQAGRANEARIGARLIRQRKTYTDRDPYGSIEREAAGRVANCDGSISRSDGSHYRRQLLPEDAPGWPIYRAAVVAIADGAPDVPPIHRVESADRWRAAQPRRRDLCAYCGAPLFVRVRGHHHTEHGKDVTR